MGGYARDRRWINKVVTVSVLNGGGVVCVRVTVTLRIWLMSLLTPVPGTNTNFKKAHDTARVFSVH